MAFKSLQYEVYPTNVSEFKFLQNFEISLSSPSCVDLVESIGVGWDCQGEPNLGVWHLN